MKRTISMPLFLTVALAGANAPLAKSQEVDSASRTKALTLEAAVQLALEHDPTLRASHARVDAASGRAQQAGSWSNPELELGAEDWPVSRGRGFSDAKQTIGIAQTLPFPGKKSLDRQIGAAGFRGSEAELALRRIELVRDVKVAFFRVLAAGRLVEVSAELVAVAESSAATARKRVAAGAAADPEQLRAEVQEEHARTELAEFEREFTAARQSLATLLGRPELVDASPTGTLTEQAIGSLPAEPTAERLAAHPSVSRAQADLDRARLEHRRVRLEPYPDVTLSAAGGRIGATDESIVQLGLSVPLPILDSGKGRQLEARANVSVAEAELHAVQQRLQREWANAQRRYGTAADQVARYRERLLPKAEAALRLVRTGFEEGKFGFMDLLDTQRTTAEARLAYQEKLLELNLAQAELEALLQPQTSTPTNSKN